jgi:hypothetical protein
MQFKNVLTGLASFLLVAILVTGCSEPLPSESSPADMGPSLAGAPVTHVEGVMDTRGPIPGLPNIQNWECVSVDAAGWTYFHECVILSEFTGDLIGSVETVLNGSRNAQGGGHVSGVFTFDVCHTELGCGTFIGDAWGAAAGGRGLLQAAGQGSGDFQDKRLKITLRETTPDSEIFNCIDYDLI